MTAPRRLAALGRWLLDRPWLALIAVLAAHVALWLAVQRDIATADPLGYSFHAHRLAFEPAQVLAAHETHPFVLRLGLTAPIALLYRLFGVSPLATNLPSLLAGLGIIAIAYAAASTPRAKLLAAGFAAVCTPLVVDGHELTADLVCAAVMAASILCLARRDRPRGARWVVAAAVVWFAAFQVKEVAVWCAPVWIWAVVRDLRAHGGRWVVHTFAPAAAVGAVLAAGYLVLCTVLWGDPLARFHGIEDAASGHYWSLGGHPTREWVARLTWQPPALLYRMLRALLLPAVLSPWLVRGRDRIWVLATAAILLLYWFGSTTFASYLPLPAQRRMVLPVLPGLLVLAALATDAAVDRIQRRIRDPWLAGAIALGFAACLVLPHITTVRKRLFLEHPDRAAYAALRAEAAATTDRIVVVCADVDCPDYTRFYFAWSPPANVAIVTAPEFTAAPLPAPARVRLMVHLERSGQQAERCAEALGLPPILWSPTVRLYDAGDGARLHQTLTRS
jgi:dolichyl-phosphate-mannose-protein mannosyltransferase